MTLVEYYTTNIERVKFYKKDKNNLLRWIQEKPLAKYLENSLSILGYPL
jgi:hypothetical protein